MYKYQRCDRCAGRGSVDYIDHTGAYSKSATKSCPNCGGNGGVKVEVAEPRKSPLLLEEAGTILKAAFPNLDWNYEAPKASNRGVHVQFHFESDQGSYTHPNLLTMEVWADFYPDKIEKTVRLLPNLTVESLRNDVHEVIASLLEKNENEKKALENALTMLG